MSGGEQQMLAIGRALMARPRLLLLDEPSMGLAPKLIQQIFSIISEINEQGTTVLLVEQNAAQALKRARHRAHPGDRRDRPLGHRRRAGRRRRGQGGVPRRRRLTTRVSCSATTTCVSSGATTSAGSRSPTGTSPQPQQADGDADEHQPAGGAQGGDVRVRQHVAEQRAEPGQRALDDEHRERLTRDAPPERRGERDRGEPVERRLEVELVGAPAQAVVQRAEDRQRPDAEDAATR